MPYEDLCTSPPTYVCPCTSPPQPSNPHHTSSDVTINTTTLHHGRTSKYAHPGFYAQVCIADTGIEITPLTNKVLNTHYNASRAAHFGRAAGARDDTAEEMSGYSGKGVFKGSGLGGTKEPAMGGF